MTCSTTSCSQTKLIPQQSRISTLSENKIYLNWKMQFGDFYFAFLFHICAFLRYHGIVSDFLFPPPTWSRARPFPYIEFGCLLLCARAHLAVRLAEFTQHHRHYTDVLRSLYLCASAAALASSPSAQRRPAPILFWFFLPVWNPSVRSGDGQRTQCGVRRRSERTCFGSVQF